MRRLQYGAAVLAALSLPWKVNGYQNYSQVEMMRAQMALMDDRPDDCPPCFNCLLPAFTCGQYSECNQYNGKCACPPGFGGEDCLQPVCGSLADGKDRQMRTGDYCDCEDGWSGINCNVCTKSKACNAMMPERTGGVCYQNGEVVKENYQMCDVTNVKIVEILDGKRPQATFSCSAEEDTCNFQFWVEHRESFYCALEDCESSADNDYDRNSTNYKCEKIKCQCIPDRMLCGENGSVDITVFLDRKIRGPATFGCLQESGGSNHCKFKEPEMDKLIQMMFGDSSIFIDCLAGECLYETEVPGFERPVKKINTPLIAGVIAGASLFVVVVILLVWYLSRRQFKYGPIHLDDSDDEGAKLMADHKPASLYFENVDYSLGEKQILDGVQGVAHPGEIMAIMGASGAGKTSFLDILARKNKRGTVHGEFYVNGEKVSDSDYKNVVGFVDQEDTMLPTLTVHETIMTSALLRLPRDMSKAAKEQRVYEVERQLGISAIKDSLIGSEEGNGRGISGGEKRRVGIACELVTSPSILFLDEPTSGLDAYNAFNVIECLITLAKTYKRTVIFTIHQPRSNIVALFDRLLLLANGKTVYSGEFSQCQGFFEHIGYSCPPGFNIADYLVDLTMHAGAPHTPLEVDNPEGDAVSVGPSSTRAIKSIASAGGSIDEGHVGSPGDSLRRPKGRRRDSLKHKQDRELFTRRKSGLDTPASQPDEPPVDPTADSQQWLRLSKQKAGQVHQIVEDPDNMPPSAPGTDLDMLVEAYANSEIAGNVHDEIQAAINSAQGANGGPNGHAGENGSAHTSAMGKGYTRIGYLRQFTIVSQRTWKNLYRNPMLMLTHYAIAILLAVLAGYLFYGLTDDIPGFQNRLGLFFFILALFGFSTLSSLTVFATERLLFIRERANGYYSPITYYLSKVLFDIIPLRIIPPIIMGSIVYPMTGLVPDAPHFFKFVLILVLFNLAAASICLFLGIIFKDNGLASLIGSLVMLFSLLFAGLLLNRDAIPKSALWLQSLSIFHYAFESLLVNEVTYLTLVDKKYGLDISVPGASILSSFGLNTQALWTDVISLGIISGVFIVLAYIAMHVLLVERR